jgi:predicted N-acetyltransferase YhbS
MPLEAAACWHHRPMTNNMSIRPEPPGDYDAVDGVVRAAFAHHPDEVSLLVERIRVRQLRPSRSPRTSR